MAKKIMLAAVLLCAAVLPAGAFEKEKATSIYREKLVIADFGNASSFAGISQGLTAELTALLVKTRRFDIMEREKLAAILKEQELQLSGAVDEQTAVRVGRLMGARYFIFGTIASADATHTEQRVTEKEKDRITGKVRYREYIDTTFRGRVSVTARLVDIETGQIMLAKTVQAAGEEKTRRAKEDKSFLQGILTALTTTADEREALAEYHKQVHLKVVNSAVQSAAFQITEMFLKEFPLSGYVLGKTEGDDYLIDLGTSKGLNSEVNLRVMGKTEVIKHPVTGEVINTRTGTSGYLKVIDLGDGTSAAKLVKGDGAAVQPGAKVEVVDPIFIWHRALASFIVPGLGQMLEKRWGSGILFLLTESLFVGGAYYFYYMSTPAYLESKNMLDTTDWDVSKGDQYNKARSGALAGMWVMIVLEAAIHIWDTIDAGYPAQKNDVFAQREREGTRVSLAYDPRGQRNFYLYRQFRF